VRFEVLLNIPFFWDFTLCPVLNKFTITVPSTLESSSPRALLEPKYEGTIFLQILGTIYPTTQSNAPEDADLYNIFTCIMHTKLFTDKEEQWLCHELENHATGGQFPA
jgi:hypothetical protein